MDHCVTSKPWSIVNEYQRSRGNNKSLFRNYLQSVSPAPKVQKISDMSSSIVDLTRVVRLISIAGIKKPRTFKSWATRYLSAIMVKIYILFFINTVTSIVFQRNREMSIKWKDASTA